jgi:hypothetical protein
MNADTRTACRRIDGLLVVIHFFIYPDDSNPPGSDRFAAVLFFWTVRG